MASVVAAATAGIGRKCLTATACADVAAIAVLASVGTRGALRHVRRHFAGSGAQAVERPALVLAHGFFGGRTVPGSPIEYFRGISSDLQAQGHEVLITEVPPTAPVAVRAEALRDQIHRWPERRSRRVAVLAHSMGGLDARYAISKLGADSLVQTLLTIATPHRGSLIADAIVQSCDTCGLSKLLQSLPVRLLAEMPDGGRCLSTEAAVAFNQDVRDSADVLYLSVGGDRGSALRTSPELLPTYLYLKSYEGGNDGCVSVASSRWGSYLRTLDMDHLHQINFPLPHRWVSGAPSFGDVLMAYRQLAEEVTAPRFASGGKSGPTDEQKTSDR